MAKHINNVFLKGINLFPKSHPLVLCYIRFLAEEIRNHGIALAEISKMENQNPGFESQFLLYRCKQIIVSDLMTSRYEDAEEANITSFLDYKNNFISFKEKVEKSGILHVQFWGLLMEETPNQIRLESAGNEILKLYKEIDVHWNRMQQLDPENIKALEIYSSFLREVTQDTEECKAIQEKINATNYINTCRYTNKHNIATFEDVNCDGTPSICVSGEFQQIGQITECSQGICRVFGYTKKELLKKNITMLMPDMFKSFHDDLLLGNKIKGESSRIVFGKLKSGYILPVWLHIASAPNLLNDFNFVGSFQMEKKVTTAEYAHFLVNKDLIITNFSSSTILIFGLKNQFIKGKHVNIAIICPDLTIKNIHKYLSKKGNRITCYKLSPEILSQDKDNDSKQQIETSRNNPCDSIDMICRVNPIKQPNKELIGYYIQLEIAPTFLNDSCIFLDKALDFQFRYSDVLERYVRDTEEISHLKENPSTFIMIHKYSNDTKNHLESNSNIIEDTIPINSESDKLISQLKQTGVSVFFKSIIPSLEQLLKYNAKEMDEIINRLSTLRKDYGENIVHYQYKDNQIVPAGEESIQALLLSQGSVQSELGSSNLNDAEENRRQAFLALNNIKSRKSLETLLVEVPYPTLTWALLITYFSTAGLATFAIVFYIYLSNYFQQVTSYITIINENYSRLVIEQYIVLNARQTVLLKK